MKIGVSVNPLFTLTGQPKNIDGIGIYTQKLCGALKKQNVQILEIYFKNLNESFCSGGLQNNLFISSNRLQSILPFTTRLKYDIDILHVTDYYIPKVKNIRIVSTVHDAIMLKHMGWLQSPLYLQELKKKILIQMCRKVDSIITVSHAVVDDLVNYFKIPENKISVVYHGISTEWYKRQSPLVTDDILKKYKINKPFFLSVGTIQRRKNLEKILNVYLNLPHLIKQNFTLVVVGKTHPRLTSNDLRKQLQLLSAAGKILWLQYVPFFDLQCLYQRAHALLYPSLAEGFGFPIIEGFASATPVITSNFGSMAELGGDAAYLVDPYSGDSIRNAIIELIENPALGEKLVKKGLERSQLFTWEKCAAETIKIYKQLL